LAAVAEEPLSVSRAAKINLAVLAMAAFVAAGLGGCGRAGPLEPPPDAQAVAKPTNQTLGDSGIPQPHARPKPIEAPKQPFFLDPLL
jgi:predicted small lipoprotein YifL